MHTLSSVIGALGIVAIVGMAGAGHRVAQSGENHVKPAVLCEAESLTPGQTAWIGVRLTIDDGWHTYWAGQNDSGMPATLNAQLPAGYTLDGWIWPAPVRHLAPGEILDHVYEGTVLAMARLSVPAEAKAGAKVTIRVKADWLVCDSSICVPEEGEASLEVTIATGPASPGTTAKDFETARARHARAWPEGDARFTAKAAAAEAKIHVEGATRLEFYADASSVKIENLIVGGAANAGSLSLRFREGTKGQISGVLGVARGGKVSEFYAVSIPVIEEVKAKAPLTGHGPEERK